MPDTTKQQPIAEMLAAFMATLTYDQLDQFCAVAECIKDTPERFAEAMTMARAVRAVRGRRRGRPAKGARG